MRICIIGHSVPVGTGIRHFEAGVAYPDSDVGDREAYFGPVADPVDSAGEGDKKQRKASKTTEVTKDDADS